MKETQGPKPKGSNISKRSRHPRGGPQDWSPHVQEQRGPPGFIKGPPPGGGGPQFFCSPLREGINVGPWGKNKGEKNVAPGEKRWKPPSPNSPARGAHPGARLTGVKGMGGGAAEEWDQK
eukprot:FR738936.1.p2 GENE.FR738936.1~~FR738936.1.p2  ORF type:complete len:120 (+),score=45.35 FR738936.1:774-1133(+)